MNTQKNVGGILIHGKNSYDLVLAQHNFTQYVAILGLDIYVEVSYEMSGHGIRFILNTELLNEWLPGWDTLNLSEKLNLEPMESSERIELEILLAMLSGPVTFQYPNYEELAASIRIRMNIVEAARRTGLSFHTNKVERPTDYWTYTEDRGFTVLPGKSLIEALRMATQPEISGMRYSFSCYRATEYVILLGIAQELISSNPALLQRLQQQWESSAVQSRKYHDIFMREYGSMTEPIPHNYYVPGDRLWFRNPDEYSSDVSGYEGSWVLYLGGGLFSNFWNPDQPYTVTSKCIEIYHWRHGVYSDSESRLQMDEAKVEERVRCTMENRVELERILNLMKRLRDQTGVYKEGGCLDASREYPRFVCLETADIFLEEQIPAQPKVLDMCVL